MIVVTIPVTKEVTISPKTPNDIIKTYPKGKPMATASRVRYRMNLVFPWPLRKLLTLRLPNAGKK